MNAQLAPIPGRFDPDEEDLAEEAILLDTSTLSPTQLLLQKLRPRHKEVCSLIAQGLRNVEVAKITGYTPEYIVSLMRQPLCIAYVKEMNEVVSARLEMTFGKVADVAIGVMETGNAKEQLQAARLHAELTKRIGGKAESPGSSESSEDRLARLANRLIDLVGVSHGAVIQGTATTVQGHTGVRGSGLLRQSSAYEADSNGRASEGNQAHLGETGTGEGHPNGEG